MGIERPLTGAERVARRRSALRAQGLKPHTFWLPDVRTAEFKAKVRASNAWLWDRTSDEAQVMAFIEAMTDEVFADLDRREAEG